MADHQLRARQLIRYLAADPPQPYSNTITEEHIRRARFLQPQYELQDGDAEGEEKWPQQWATNSRSLRGFVSCLPWKEATAGYIAVEPPAVEPPAVEPPAVEPPAVEAHVVEIPAIETPAAAAPVVEPQEDVVEPQKVKGYKRDDDRQAGAWHSLYEAYEAAAALGQRLLDGPRAIFSESKPLAYRTENFE